MYWLCRGIDHEPVRVRQLTQSVGCGKNFRGAQKLKTKADVSVPSLSWCVVCPVFFLCIRNSLIVRICLQVHKWLGNFADEIVERLEKDKQQV